MRLVFVRHAESIGNVEGRWQGHSDYPLSNLGYIQAKQLERHLKARRFVPTHIYTSPLRRASQTADILVKSWSGDVTEWDELKEFDVGLVSGLTREEAQRKLPHVDFDIEESRQLAGVEGAESLIARRDRGKRIVDKLVADHKNKNTVLVVSHGGILQHAIAALLGTRRVWGYTTRNTALFDFDVDTENWNGEGEQLIRTTVCRINRFNDITHLDES